MDFIKGRDVFMKMEKLSQESLQNVSGGVSYEDFINQCSIETEDENGNLVRVTDIRDIDPDKHYWLNPNSRSNGNWAYKIILGYGRDGLVYDYWDKLHGQGQHEDDELRRIYRRLLEEGGL